MKGLVDEIELLIKRLLAKKLIQHIKQLIYFFFLQMSYTIELSSQNQII